jgi:hypothetical protein
MLGGSQAVSAAHLPFRIIPERGQVSENTVDPAIKQVCDVLQDNDFGSNVANQSNDVPVEARSCAVDPLSIRICRADILTWKSATDGIDVDAIVSETGSSEGCDIVIAWNVWPVFRQHSAAIGIDFAERHGSECAAALEAEAEAADAAE